ncbi:23174_t:CDS:2 [Entrophospora sp. SA101]|nr:15106_t:CDS:2 [Entrophospora sp. SA101]CAJ0748906.1 23174_t:CDS:2 [Entrophospora sp. SA101]CAJ0845086.1 8005_t:CDS:2 [Entrophospora sp. SA101]
MFIRLACRLAEKLAIIALATGDSLAQVASQTVESLTVISQVSSLIIFRPLISFNKQEIIQLAQKIDTYSLALASYQDCCNLFEPRHPVTKPRLAITETKQPNKFTVQGYIENILSKVFSQKISVLGASRTDKGVHAHDQNFTLRLNLSFTERKLLNLLKKILAKYLLVKKVKKVTSSFHPIRSVIKKEYRYFINVGKYNTFQKKYR